MNAKLDCVWATYIAALGLQNTEVSNGFMIIYFGSYLVTC
jgi:hypothetical protein